jgi:hypothetical protein
MMKPGDFGPFLDIAWDFGSPGWLWMHNSLRRFYERTIISFSYYLIVMNDSAN